MLKPHLRDERSNPKLFSEVTRPKSVLQSAQPGATPDVRSMAPSKRRKTSAAPEPTSGDTTQGVRTRRSASARSDVPDAPDADLEDEPEELSCPITRTMFRDPVMVVENTKKYEKIRKNTKKYEQYDMIRKNTKKYEKIRNIFFNAPLKGYHKSYLKHRYDKYYSVYSPNTTCQHVFTRCLGMTLPAIGFLILICIT